MKYRKDSGRIRNIIKMILFVFLPAFLLTLMGTIYILKLSDQAELESIKNMEAHQVLLQTENLEKDIQGLSSDLSIVSKQRHFLELWDENNNIDNNILSTIAQEYLLISSHRKVYDQIRLLDVDGDEILRVNYNNGFPGIVGADKLQNKKGRYYFDDSYKLNRGEIFVSPLDLNIEHGEIELPHKPMIRLATPIYDNRGIKRGVALINYLAINMLDRFESQVDISRGNQSMLINSDGYWLSNPDERNRWGFMYEDRKDRIFGQSHRDAWERINGVEECQFINDKGMYTCRTIHPLLEGQKSSTGAGEAYEASFRDINANEYYWKVVSFIPRDMLFEAKNQRRMNSIVIVSILSILYLMASIFVAQSIERRNRYEAMLKSNGEKLRMLNKIIRHDLANDLAVIKSAVKIYNRNSDPNILSEVDNRVNKGLAAISDYKKYEEMLSVESKLYDYDITKIINSVWKNYQQLNLSIQGDAYVIADDSISSVFENLFSNAIRHGKASAINIGIKNTKDNSIITFSDNGKGIPDTIKDRIFEEGFHYGDTGNTGIGLYIVRQSIESYGGRITVADNKPRGTMFEIILRRALKQDQ